MKKALLNHKKLKEALEALPRTQEQIAEELGVSDRQLRYWQEKDTDAAISSCVRLSQLLMTPIEDLLIFHEDQQAE